MNDFNALRVALRIDSGIIIFIFDERENLRIFPFIFFTRRVVEENGRCSVAAMATFCLLSACKDAPLGQRQGGVFRLPPPYLWTPPTPQRAKGCSPLTILKKKSKHKKASAAPVGAIALTLFSLLHP